MKVSNSGTPGTRTVFGPMDKSAVDQPAGAAPKRGSRKDGKIADGFEKSQAPNRMEQLLDSPRPHGGSQPWATTSPGTSGDSPAPHGSPSAHGGSAPESNKVGSTDPQVKASGNGTDARGLTMVGTSRNPSVRREVEAQLYSTQLGSGTPAKREVEAFVRDTKLGSGTPAKAPQPAAGDRLTPDLFSLNPDGSLAIRNGLSDSVPGPSMAPDDGGKVARGPGGGSDEKKAIDNPERGYLR